MTTCVVWPTRQDVLEANKLGARDILNIKAGDSVLGRRFQAVIIIGPLHSDSAVEMVNLIRWKEECLRCRLTPGGTWMEI